MQDTLWVTKDGRELLVGDMSDSHLEHSIAKILRSKNWRRSFLDRLILERTIRAIKRSD